MKCIICGKEIKEGQEGHDPRPISEVGKCCDDCYYTTVANKRLFDYLMNKDKEKDNNIIKGANFIL